jgi:hypothetical protein
MPITGSRSAARAPVRDPPELPGFGPTARSGFRRTIAPSAPATTSRGACAGWSSGRTDAIGTLRVPWASSSARAVSCRPSERSDCPHARAARCRRTAACRWEHSRACGTSTRCPARMTSSSAHAARPFRSGVWCARLASQVGVYELRIVGEVVESTRVREQLSDRDSGAVGKQIRQVSRRPVAARQAARAAACAGDGLDATTAACVKTRLETGSYPNGRGRDGGLALSGTVSHTSGEVLIRGEGGSIREQ